MRRISSFVGICRRRRAKNEGRRKVKNFVVSKARGRVRRNFLISREWGAEVGNFDRVWRCRE